MPSIDDAGIDPVPSLNKYGYTAEEWAALDQKAKNRAYDKLSYRRRKETQPERWRARKRAQNLRARLKLDEQHREATRLADRERYHRNPELFRARARKNYQKYHAKHLARAKARDSKITSRRRFARSPAEVYELIGKSVPRALPRHTRDDLIGTLCLAVLEGKLLVKNIKVEVGKYLAAHNREYDTFKTVSLDAAIPGTNKRYVDTIASDAEHF
jgi:hypothetical protein